MLVDACESLNDWRAMRVAADFVSAGRRAESLGDLGSLLSLATRALGFTYYAMVHHGSLCTHDGAQLALVDYPESWRERFDTEGLHRFDPVQAACRHQLVGFAWSDLRKAARLTPRQDGILARPPPGS